MFPVFRSERLLKYNGNLLVTDVIAANILGFCVTLADTFPLPPYLGEASRDFEKADANWIAVVR